MKYCQCTQLVSSTMHDGALWKAMQKCFWSILTVNTAKLLLVVPPCMVKSFVGFGLMANQIRQVAINVTESLRLSIMTVNWLIGIGGLHWGNNKICSGGQQTEGSHLENYDGEQNCVVTFTTWWRWSQVCIQKTNQDVSRTSVTATLFVPCSLTSRKDVYKLSFDEIGIMITLLCCISA